MEGDGGRWREMEGDLLAPVIPLAQALHKRRDELAARLVVELGVVEYQGADLTLIVLAERPEEDMSSFALRPDRDAHARRGEIEAFEPRVRAHEGAWSGGHSEPQDEVRQ